MEYEKPRFFCAAAKLSIVGEQLQVVIVCLGVALVEHITRELTVVDKHILAIVGESRSLADGVLVAEKSYLIATLSKHRQYIRKVVPHAL